MHSVVSDKQRSSQALCQGVASHAVTWEWGLILSPKCIDHEITKRDCVPPNYSHCKEYKENYFEPPTFRSSLQHISLPKNGRNYVYEMVMLYVLLSASRINSWTTRAVFTKWEYEGFPLELPPTRAFRFSKISNKNVVEVRTCGTEPGLAPFT